MEIAFVIYTSDGSDITVDSRDEISLYTSLPTPEITRPAYSWKDESHIELLNDLHKYNFISIKRKYPVEDELIYRDHEVAKGDSLLLRTSAISSILDPHN
jgi:transketolase C-terminal domain/subunit